MTSSETKEIMATARDGTRIVYRLRPGSPGAARVVLVHSLAMTHSYWDEVVSRLAPDCGVLVYDCRGHGGSDKPKGPYSLEQFSDDLADLMDSVGWSSATVAGSSMGGSVALAFAIRHGTQVDALGLIDTTAWYGENAPKQWSERAAKAKNEGLQSLLAFQRTRWFSESFCQQRPEVVAEAESVFVANDVEAYVATCHMLGNFDLRPGLPSIKAPTAILVGEEDYATTPAMASEMHQAIAGSTFRVIPRVRHLTPLEVPELVASEIGRLCENGRR